MIKLKIWSILFFAIAAVLYAGCLAVNKDADKAAVNAEQNQNLTDEKDNTRQINALMKSFESQNSILPPLEKPPVKKEEYTGPYLLDKGDVIEISVLDEPEMTRNVSVIPDGTITYLLVGEIQAKGKTLKGLREELEVLLKEYFVKPRVSVILNKLHEEKEMLEDIGYVSLMGALSHPGKYKITKGDRITDAVAQAGGLLYINDFQGGRSIANLKASYISRNGVKLDIDFDKLLRLGDMRFNISVEMGDFIYIGEADTDAIIVLGEVALPQIIPHNRDISIVEAISRCGGFTEKGMKSEVIIIKASPDSEVKCVKVDLEALLLGTGKDKNILLEGGDIVFVPEHGLSEYARYAGYLITFADLVLKAYNVRDQIRFPKLTRHGTGSY
ncbi:MAG TPA: hypothetical protein DCZ94_08035 [Lentisphaeria bacterium]|nr:MAG: hypothetical protein A2X48_19510 [Lentisphaerae bacterium GWF2_49_21]HBC86887.1 hypothetical protein [Lentisphaeria bacterium]